MGLLLWIIAGMGFTSTWWHYYHFVHFDKEMPGWVKIAAFFLGWIVFPYTLYYVVSNWDDRTSPGEG
jgi:hypothetical protein